MDVRVGILQGVAAVLVRDQRADGVGRSGAPHVRAHVRGEEAARAGQQRLLEGDGQGEPPHGVGLGLLLEGEGEDGAVDAGGDEVRGDQGRRSADGARRVDAEQGFADGAERVGEVELRHHDALEEVGRLADHDGVDVGPAQPGVLQGADRRFADESGDGHVVPGGDVFGLADADDGDGLLTHERSPLPGRRPGSVAGRARRWRGRARGRTRPGGRGRRPRRAGSVRRP